MAADQGGYVDFEQELKTLLEELNVKKNSLKGKKNRHKRAKVNAQIKEAAEKLVAYNSLDIAPYEPPLQEDWLSKSNPHLKVYEQRFIEAGARKLVNMSSLRLKNEFNVTNGRHRNQLLKLINEFVARLQWQKPLEKGWVKHIIHEGDGKTYPKPGNELSVLYHGTLRANPKFCLDQCWSTIKPFKFSVGKKNVIQGWDEALMTFSKGEQAKITIRADYAYGEAETPTIPAGSDLIFVVKLLDIQDAPPAFDWAKSGISGLDLKNLLAGNKTPEELKEAFSSAGINLNVKETGAETKEEAKDPNEIVLEEVEIQPETETKEAAKQVATEVVSTEVAVDDDDDQLPELAEVSDSKQEETVI